MALTKGLAKYIAIMSLSYMGVLLFVGCVSIYVSQFPHLFDAMIISIGVMLFLKGKISDSCVGNRDKHKPNIVLGIILIALIIISNFGSINADKASGTYQGHSLLYLISNNSYQLFVEYISYSVIYVIAITIINLIKFRKRGCEVQTAPSSENVVEVANDNVENSEIKEPVNETPLAQTPPPINSANISEE